MSIKVNKLGDPILRRVCLPLSEEQRVTMLPKLLSDMHETMTHEQGVGLAANQIGHSVRVFILKTNNGYAEYINPTIVEKRDLRWYENEGCLSIPGTSATTQRYYDIDLKWTDRDGIERENRFTGAFAVAVQHEMDHLDGKLYIDQFGPLKKELVIKKHKKFLKHGR